MTRPDQGDEKSGTSPKPRSVSFRVSLLRNFILIILLFSIAILSVSIIAARRATRALCQDLVLSGTDRLEIQLRRFFEPIPRHLFIARDWAKHGLFDELDPDRMLTLFGPFLEKSPQVSSINTGDDTGNGYMLLYDGETWLGRSVARETSGDTAHWRKWASLDGPAESSTEELGYDLRERPWFKAAAADDAPVDTVFWTEPYSFFTTNDPGITASIRASNPDGSMAIIAADLLLSDISRITREFEISPSGFVVITTSDVRAIGLPKHPSLTTEEEIKEAFLKGPRELGIPLFTAASLMIREHFDLEPGTVLSVERGLSAENQPFRWKFEGKQWWTHVRPCVIDNGPQLWIGVAVPEHDFLGELRQGRKYYYGFAAAALVIAIFSSTHLARRFSTPIQALIRQSDHLRTLNTSERIDPGDTTGIREIGQLYDAQERMRLALDSFARYVPGDVVRELLDKGEAAVIGGRNTSISILFTDIEGFTAIAESMSPGDLTRHMASYFDAMLGVIASNSGTVDKLIGDAIVAFWGAPRSNADHARDAVRAALACRDKLEHLNREWEEKGLPRLPTRFGISTGEVVVGNVGSSARLSYTALGDAVNLASRLEGANNVYGTRTLVSETTVHDTGDEFAWRKVDIVRVKGRSEPELIFELLGDKDRVDETLLARARTYESALEDYLDRRFKEAFATLVKLEETSPGDKSVARLAESCRLFVENPPPGDWKGVSQLTSK